MFRPSTFHMTAIALAVGLSAAASAPAATIATKTKMNASGWCQAAVPSGAGSVLRARPLGLGNEGATNATVSCSFPYDDDHVDEFATQVGLFIVNTTGAPANVTCTLINGVQTGTSSTATFTAKSQLVAGNGTWNPVWVPGDITPAPVSIGKPNFSCGLPPGFVMTYIYQRNAREIGS